MDMTNRLSKNIKCIEADFTQEEFESIIEFMIENVTGYKVQCEIDFSYEPYELNEFNVMGEVYTIEPDMDFCDRVLDGFKIRTVKDIENVELATFFREYRVDIKNSCLYISLKDMNEFVRNYIDDNIKLQFNVDLTIVFKGVKEIIKLFSFKKNDKIVVSRLVEECMDSYIVKVYFDGFAEFLNQLLYNIIGTELQYRYFINSRDIDGSTVPFRTPKCEIIDDEIESKLVQKRISKLNTILPAFDGKTIDHSEMQYIFREIMREHVPFISCDKDGDVRLKFDDFFGVIDLINFKVKDSE